jgi:hypothetical protein
MKLAVSAPHIPTPLDQLGQRPFSFYPAIRNVEHNEWTFRGVRWDEIQVINTKSQEQLSIPRSFLGGVSSSEEPFIIVGLWKELEYKEGVVIPHVRRVLEMRRAVNDIPRFSAPLKEPGSRAAVVGIRVEPPAEARSGRKFITAVSVTILTSLVGLLLFRDGPLSTRARFFNNAPVRIALPFTSADGYQSIVDRFGPPAETRARSASSGATYQLLRYPGRSLILVLAGAQRNQSNYIGAFGRGGRVVHTVMLPTGQDSITVLTRLR